MMSRGYDVCIMDVAEWGNYGKVVHSEGKDEERDVAILRLQGGSPHLCQLRTASF
jgi:hypothetical protein